MGHSWAIQIGPGVTTAGKAFARRFVDADPMSSEKVNHRTSRNHQKREG
jgi:hypothetical protein